MANFISPDQEGRIYDLILQGLSNSAIGKDLGIHRNTIAKYRSKTEQPTHSLEELRSNLIELQRQFNDTNKEILRGDYKGKDKLKARDTLTGISVRISQLEAQVLSLQDAENTRKALEVDEQSAYKCTCQMSPLTPWDKRESAMLSFQGASDKIPNDIGDWLLQHSKLLWIIWNFAAEGVAQDQIALGQTRDSYGKIVPLVTGKKFLEQLYPMWLINAVDGLEVNPDEIWDSGNFKFAQDAVRKACLKERLEIRTEAQESARSMRQMLEGMNERTYSKRGFKTA